MQAGGFCTILLGLLALGSVHAEAADLQAASPPSSASPSPSGAARALAAPVDTTLGPAQPGGGWLPGAGPGFGGPGFGSPGFGAPGFGPGPAGSGEVSTMVGSGGMYGTAIRMNSGVIGGNTVVSVMAANEQGPRFHDLPRVNTTAVGVGIETKLPFGSSLSLMVGQQQDRWSRGGVGPTVP